MIVALDVHYSCAGAVAAAIVFDDWASDRVVASYTAVAPVAADYEPGNFYQRELEPLLAVIARIAEAPVTYVIDAYCHLAPDLPPGLGAHLSEALGRPATIIGVAKTRYRQATHAVELLRGASQRPLFITSIGIPYDLAADHIAAMHGPHRLPTHLKSVDRLARGFAP